MSSRFAPAPGMEHPGKKLAGEKAADKVKDGMVVGLGTGTTVYYTLRKLGKRIKEEELEILGIPTSHDTRNSAEVLGIPLTSLDEHSSIDLTIDGADEVDPNLDLIKGLGGALLMEKIVASSSSQVIIVVDDDKIVPQLGQRKLPVEILRFGSITTMKRLKGIGLQLALRSTPGGIPFITDNNGYIVDCLPGPLEDPAKMESTLNTIPGVVENGLFIGLVDQVYVGKKDNLQILEGKTD